MANNLSINMLIVELSSVNSLIIRLYYLVCWVYIADVLDLYAQRVSYIYPTYWIYMSNRHCKRNDNEGESDER